MLNELVIYCDSLLGQNTCLKGKEVSPINCSNCLKEIHFTNNQRREYDCQNMCCQYVCQNMHRYVTEMVYLFHDAYAWMKDQDNIRICSIGCGPCSELVAWEEYIHIKSLSPIYSYDGFDINETWTTIQEKVRLMISPSATVSFHNDDFFEYYSEKKEKPNVIVLNYLLSYILMDDIEEGKIFIRRLVEFLAQLPSYAILINDINLGLNQSHARYYYDRLAKYLCRSSQNFKYTKWHFKNSKKPYFAYGNERPDSNIHFEIPDEIQDNMPNTECHSAQLLIIKSDDTERK